MTTDHGRLSQEPGKVPASFGLVWRSMADILGTAATAAIVRRAARRAALRFPGLAGLDIARKTYTPDYSLPSTWSDDSALAAATREFQALLDELMPLLQELTGAVVVRRLARLSLPVGQVRAPLKDNPA